MKQNVIVTDNFSYYKTIDTSTIKYILEQYRFNLYSTTTMSACLLCSEI